MGLCMTTAAFNMIVHAVMSVPVSKTKSGFACDDRCQASVVAVSVAISLMLQRRPQHLDKKGHYKVDQLIKDTYDHAAQCLETDKDVGALLLSCPNYLSCSVTISIKIFFSTLFKAETEIH